MRRFRAVAGLQRDARLAPSFIGAKMKRSWIPMSIPIENGEYRHFAYNVKKRQSLEFDFDDDMLDYVRHMNSTGDNEVVASEAQQWMIPK
jgi:hypothetical protein